MDKDKEEALRSFVTTIGMEFDVAFLLVSNGVASLEEVAYVPLEEMLTREGLDRETYEKQFSSVTTHQDELNSGVLLCNSLPPKEPSAPSP